MRIKHILLGLAAGILLMTACARRTEKTAPPQPPLQIGWSRHPGWYPLLIADQQQFFEKHGVEVNLTFYATYEETSPSLASGYLDAGALALGDTLLDEVAKDVKVVLITNTSNGTDQLLAVPGIRTAEDVRGKRIGVMPGAAGRLLVREMLADYQLDSTDVKIIAVPPEQIPGALSQYIDIGYTYEPYATEARAQGNNVLYTSANTPDLLFNVIAFRTNTLTERPQDVRNFINAWFDALTYLQSNPQESAAIAAAALGQETGDISFSGINFLNRAANTSAFQPGADRQSVTYAAEADLRYLVHTGLITRSININEMFDPAYLK